MASRTVRNPRVLEREQTRSRAKEREETNLVRRSKNPRITRSGQVEEAPLSGGRREEREEDELNAIRRERPVTIADRVRQQEAYQRALGEKETRLRQALVARGGTGVLRQALVQIRRVRVGAAPGVERASLKAPPRAESERMLIREVQKEHPSLPGWASDALRRHKRELAAARKRKPDREWRDAA